MDAILVVSSPPHARRDHRHRISAVGLLVGRCSASAPRYSGAWTHCSTRGGRRIGAVLIVASPHRPWQRPPRTAERLRDWSLRLSHRRGGGGGDRGE